MVVKETVELMKSEVVEAIGGVELKVIVEDIVEVEVIAEDIVEGVEVD